jgi:predicted secreted protein
LAACAPKSEVTKDAPLVAAPEAKLMNGAVPAPTPAGVTQRITVADDGRTIVVPVGGRFAVELVGVPTAGYLWGVTTKPAFLSDAVESGGNTTTAQSQPGFTGGNHWEVFTFQSTTVGEGKLKLEQRRPWEKDEPASRTFTVTIQSR